MLIGAVLLVAIVIALAVWFGTSGKDDKRPPRIHGAPPPSLVTSPPG